MVFARRFFTVLAACIGTALGFMGCEDAPYFKPEVIDKALYDFYHQTGGPTKWPDKWKAGWDTKEPCAWDGDVRKHPNPAGTRCFQGGWHKFPPVADGGLLFLEHHSGMATGPVPAAFEAFQMTDYISLWGNKLNGPIWNTSYHCFLHRLDLSHNDFSGELGADFMRNNKHHGEVINLAFNRFSGPIPAGVAEMQPLTSLVLNNNQFSGPLPDLSHAKELRQLSVSHNLLTGPLGDWLDHVENLALLEVAHNKFTGPLPSRLPKRLSRFDGSGNAFSGTIPEEWGQLPFLRYFNCTGCDVQCPPGKSDLLARVPFTTHCGGPKHRLWQ